MAYIGIAVVSGLMALSFAPVAAAQDTIRVPSDPSFNVRVSDLPSDCVGSERIYLSVGGRLLAPARSDVTSLTPAQIVAHGRIDNPGALLLEFPAQVGCPSRPFVAGAAAIRVGDEALPFGVIIADMAGGAFREMGRLRDSGQCPAMDATRVACAGSTQVDGQVVEVAAVIASAPTAVASDGAPLFMICEAVEEGWACEASGERNGVEFKAVVEQPAPPTVDEMRHVYSRIDAAFSDWVPNPT